MAEFRFQFRKCLNPDCGLRYPMLESDQIGERCPLCMGETSVAAEARQEAEITASDSRTKLKTCALLDNLRSAWNVGAILRTAEGFGLEHLYLCGITPTPADAQVQKTALGAQNIIGWSAHRDAVDLAGKLRSHGRAIWALEQTANSRPIEVAMGAKVPLHKIVLVVGNERAGVDPGLLELADQVIHLPMQGRKRSFNVAVAFAIAMHTLKFRNQNSEL